MVIVFAVALMASLDLPAIRWTSASPESQLFAQFWEPVFEEPGPLLLAVGHPIVYHPSMRALQNQPFPPNRKLR